MQVTCGSLDGHLQVVQVTCGSLDGHLQVVQVTCGSLDGHLQVVQVTCGSLDGHLQVVQVTCGSLDGHLQVVWVVCGSLDGHPHKLVVTCGSLDGHLPGCAGHVTTDGIIMPRTGTYFPNDSLCDEYYCKSSALHVFGNKYLPRIGTHHSSGYSSDSWSVCPNPSGRMTGYARHCFFRSPVSQTTDCQAGCCKLTAIAGSGGEVHRQAKSSYFFFIFQTPCVEIVQLFTYFCKLITHC